MTDYDQINKELFLKAIEAADPKLLIPKYIPKKPKENLLLLVVEKHQLQWQKVLRKIMMEITVVLL